jgi:hypothetical protein
LRECALSFCGGRQAQSQINGRGATDLKVLGHAQQRRVREHDCFRDVVDREVHARAPAEAVARRAECGYTVSLESRDHHVEDRARARWPVVPVLEPRHRIERFLRAG